MEDNNKYLEFAKDIAMYAGKIMMKYFNTNNGASYKSDHTIVTKADKEINSYLVEKVKKIFPTHSVDGEEESFGKSNYVWVCDPIDGTAMYARGIPTACFSLALVIDGSPIIGVVYDPFCDNLYSAIKGMGAYKNDKKISVNDVQLGDMKSFSDFDAWPEAEYYLFDILKELGEKTNFIGLGSIVRAGVSIADGKLNFVIYPGTKHKNCDIAAIKVIVEEAGGIVTDLFGNEQRYDQDINGVIISNKVVYDDILSTIKKHLK